MDEIGLGPADFPCPDTSLPGHDASTWQEMLQEVVDCKEMSFAEVNRKRKRLTFQSFQDDLLPMKTVAMELLSEPNAHRIHIFFGRSHTIATLQHLPSSATDQRTKLEQQFLSWFEMPALDFCLSLFVVSCV